MFIFTTCPECGHNFEIDPDALVVRCNRCGHRYGPDDGNDGSDDPDPDYGGAFDGVGGVFSDADPGL